MKDLRGKRAFVTGGSKGIGRAMALRLAREGARVVVAARGREALDEALEALRAAGPADARHGAVQVDVTDWASVRAAADEAVGILGGIDLVVCNAGGARPGYIRDVDVETFERQVRLNYMGHVHTVKAFLPRLLEQGSGHVQLVSSVIGFLPVYGYGAYCASKFAVTGFAEVLRLELVGTGVEVSLFFPPTTETPGLEEENRIKPREVWLLESDSAFSSIYAPDQVAESMVALVRRGGFSATHGAPNRFLYHFNRLFPGIARWVNDGEVRKAIRKARAERASS